MQQTSYDDIGRPVPAEFDAFQRFLEGAYGHSRGFFTRNYPHLYRQDADALEASVVLRQGGEIVCHVGAFPLRAVAGQARIQMGGIGGVATLPAARGRGLMAQAMEGARRLMKERGDVLAVLWGDRQRYRHFGYESCGLKWIVTLTSRSLQAAGVEPADVDEVDPRDDHHLERVTTFHEGLAFRVERPHFPLMLHKEGVRLFLGSEGYVLLRGEGRDLRVLEVATTDGTEAELVAGVMARTFGTGATVEVVPEEGVGARRLVQASARWSLAPQGMFCILDWPGLAKGIAPLLEVRAQHVAPFSLAVGCRHADRVEVVTFTWDGTRIAVEEGRHSDAYVEGAQLDLVAALLGGPFDGALPLGALEPLLPVSLHIPLLDHV